MINQKTISNFKIRKSRSGKLSIYYKDRQFIVFSEKILFSIILETAPSWFLKSLVEKVDRPEIIIDNGLEKFANVYAFEKLKFYKKSVIDISDNAVLISSRKMLKEHKTVSSFKEAIRIMKDHKVVDISLFIKSQIAGLEFVNNGKGTFPNPSQLSSEGALTRLLQYTSLTNKSEKSEKPARYWFFDEKIDGDISLKDNSKYIEAIEKIKNRTADMNAVLYAKKCHSKRRSGDTYLVIEEYLKDISV